MAGHGRHTPHFVWNERCLVRPTWLKSRWIQWDQRAGELGCSFQRLTGSGPIRPRPPRRATFPAERVCVCVCRGGEGAVGWGGGGGLALRKDSLNTLGSLKRKKPLGCRSGGCRCIVPAQRRRSQPRARLRRTWYLSIHCAHH